MSERRKMGLFGKINDETPTNNFQERPVLYINSDKTAIISPQRPSLEDLKADGSAQLLAEQASEDVRIKAENYTHEREHKFKERLTFIQTEMSGLSHDYNDALSRKASELHATGEAQRIGWGKYQVQDWVQAEDGERFACELTYRRKRNKKGGRDYIPESYTQSLTPEHQLDDQNQQQLHIGFRTSKEQNLISSLSVSNSERLRFLVDNYKRLRYLHEITRGGAHNSNKISLSMNSPIPRVVVENKGRNLEKREKQVFKYTTNFKFEYESSALKLSGGASINSTIFVDMAKEILSLIPTERLNA
jgi:hypothetical protein